MTEPAQPEDLRAAFERTALPHLGSVSFLAQRLAGAGPDADDLVQETFLRAWAAFDRFVSGTNARSWLITIALNLFRDRMRRKGRDPISLGETLPDPPAPESAPALPPAEMLDPKILKALDALSPTSRTVIVLAVMEGLPRTEIAGMLDCPVGTVRALLSRAKSELRRMLTPL